MQRPFFYVVITGVELRCSVATMAAVRKKELSQQLVEKSVDHQKSDKATGCTGQANWHCDPGRAHGARPCRLPRGKGPERPFISAWHPGFAAGPMTHQKIEVVGSVVVCRCRWFPLKGEDLLNQQISFLLPLSRLEARPSSSRIGVNLIREKDNDKKKVRDKPSRSPIPRLLPPTTCIPQK